MKSGSGRQVGKTSTLAAWAVDRLITRPGRLVTVLSNSKTNGMELNRKCADVCAKMGQAFEQEDLSQDQRFETMNRETRVRINGQVGRIVILAANPRTARGFSGDLILDEFAFHENADAIWEAVEPILSANQDFLCRIASTPNGKHNLFYRLCADGRIFVRRVTRTEAFAHGVPIYHPVTRERIDPATARALAHNKRAYDQNYECSFDDQSMCLLTNQLIDDAEDPAAGFICDQDWSSAALALLRAPIAADPGKKTAREWIDNAADPDDMQRHIFLNVCKSDIYAFERLLRSDYDISLEEVFDETRVRSARDAGRFLFAGVDVGRHKDYTVISVVERLGSHYRVRAMLRLDQMSLPEQQQRLETILDIPSVRLVKIDMTGLGIGLYEYTRQKYNERIVGVDFASSVPISDALQNDGRRGPNVRVTEALATQLLQVYEDRAIHHPVDHLLREDLRKPERIFSSSGRVSIAAARDKFGHADHFWSLALAIDAAKSPPPVEFYWHSFTPRARLRTTTL